MKLASELMFKGRRPLPSVRRCRESNEVFRKQSLGHFVDERIIANARFQTGVIWKRDLG
jgi:hypothetical protein